MITIDPELAAAELLARADVERPQVDPLKLCERWPRLRVSHLELDGAGYLLDLGAHGGELLIRRSDPATRRRYTAAHELGHWVLRSDIDSLGARDRQPALERWCDRFAAALLMPAAWVIEAVGARLDIEMIACLHRRFGVSRQAALLRVGELAPLELAVAGGTGDGPLVAWSTAKPGADRFDWIAEDWLRERLHAATGTLQIRSDGLELQAARLDGSRWLLALGSIAALQRWREPGARPRTHVLSPAPIRVRTIPDGSRLGCTFWE